ncbi:MAG: hypothetical protein ABEN55_24240 [Bradymonadaceae bacterium]
MEIRQLLPCAVSALALFGAGCPTSPTPEVDTGGGADGGDVVAPDTGPTDTGPTDTGPTDTGPTDTGPEPDGAGGDADADPSVPPTDFYYFTTGGGVASSNDYEARLSIGAPSPRGAASSEAYRLQIAPVSP